MSDDGVYVCGGYNGHGMPWCFSCGRAMARLIHFDNSSSGDGDSDDVEYYMNGWYSWLKRTCDVNRFTT